ncbi:hypothetical protein CMI41_01685 [Candidatus Pacearchaeota archaeon]|nr:hypothetical protein [Candidatus Pacearchaeota archaeon]|tara:strand:+ start:3283 stop:4143 length:861 start_codon:yes stop_codon:yes gene_type:complete
MNKLKNKRGDEKYYILISLILGLILIGIIFSWIFQEYLFGGDELDLVECKQSILTRHNLPQAEWGNKEWLSLKDKFPLECETQVIDIDENNKDEARTIIANAIAACWALYEKGEVSLFPGGGWTTGAETTCFTCARITFDSEIKNEFEGNNAIKVYDNDVTGDRGFLLDKMPGTEMTYLDYLSNGGYNIFRFKSDFEIITTETAEKKRGDIYYPEIVDAERGDLHITLSSWVYSGSDPLNQIIFYQNVAENLKKITNSDGESTIYDSMAWNDEITAVCEYWDGINI